MSLKGIRTRMGAMICALALLAVGVVVGLATNQASAATAASAAAAPTASGTVVMLTPCRVADSRDWITLSTFNAYQTEYLGVTGTCGVPWGAAGVILNVTVVPSPWFSYGGGWVTVYPDGSFPPNVSQVSYNWYTDTYVSYCSLLGTWAAASGPGVTPDMFERALFDGQRSPS